jgi:hypothetical protein
MKSLQVSPWAMIWFGFILIFLCITPDLQGKTVLSFGSTAVGSSTTIQSDGIVDAGRDRKFSWEGSVGYSCMDLLENPWLNLSLSANIALDFASDQRIAVGDLTGLPALRLLLNPLEFPYSSLPCTFSLSSPMGKIPLISTGASAPLEGMVYTVSRPSGFFLASFVFLPVFSLGGTRGGGFVSLFNTTAGKLEVGGCHSVRDNMGSFPDEILYGRYPFTHGSFFQAFFRSNPLILAYSQQHDSTIQALCNLSYSHDIALGGGFVQGMSLILSTGLIKVVWEKQSLPVVSGSPVSRIPLGDTYLQGRTLLGISCTSRFLRVDWEMNEKLWYVAPYAGSYQKKNHGTTAEVTYMGDSGSIGVELSTEISFNDTGTRICKREVSVTFQSIIGSVSTKITPYFRQVEGSVPSVALSGGIEGNLREGLSWGSSFQLGQQSSTLTMSASYTHGAIRIACGIDELRRMNLSITIDR